jgi:hypothetical protein
LTQTFPGFAENWNADELADREREGTATFHSIMFPFTQYFGANHSSFSDRQVRELAGVINQAVDTPDELENAVSTCFLEHLRQLRSYKVLAPHLSTEAKRRTHA